jgi:hypothetical protein
LVLGFVEVLGFFGGATDDAQRWLGEVFLGVEFLFAGGEGEFLVAGLAF